MSWLAGAVLLFAYPALAAEIYFVGPGNDLADGSNWSSYPWTSEDTLVVATNYCDISESGLTVSADLPASTALQFGRMPAYPVPVNFGGHVLNTRIEIAASHKDSENKIPIIASGGWTNVSQVASIGHNTCFCLTNGMFYVDHPYVTQEGSWWPVFKILKGATLKVSNVNAEFYCFRNFIGGALEIDGGTLWITGPRNNHMWNRLIYMGRTATTPQNTYTIRNGGAFIDDTIRLEDFFWGRVSVLIDGSRYIATNTVNNYRSLFFGAYGPFAVTNSTIRIPQFYTGKYVNSDFGFNANMDGTPGAGAKFTFHNSEVTFGFAPGRPVAGAGFAYSPVSSNCVLRLSGESNNWRSHCLMINGRSNAVEVAGGAFAVTNILRVAEGIDCSLEFSGGTSAIEDLTVVDTATNFTLRAVGGASASVNGTLDIGGRHSRVELRGEAPALAVNRLAMSTPADAPATFSFAVPAGGYAAAPLRGGEAAQGAVVASDAIFEFDMADFVYGKRKIVVPLIQNGGGITADVDALNAANAVRLPENAGFKSSLVLSADGKTLALAVPGKGGTMMLFK